MSVAAFVAALAYPIMLLWRFPRDVRLWIVQSRLVPEFRDYHRVSRARWFTREISTIASGIETDHYFELELTDGRKVAVCDRDDRAVERALATRGLLPAAAVSLGYEPLGVMWVFSLAAYVVVAFVCALVC